MKVLYDHQAFTMQYFGGVSNCFCNLISYLPHKINSKIGIIESNNLHLLESKICPDIKPVTYDIHSFTSKYNFKGKRTLYTLANNLLPFIPSTENKNKNKCIKLLKEGDFDVFHPTFFDDYFLKFLKNKPFVLTIHDMMPELFPEYFKKHNLQITAKKKLVKKAAAIIAVSNQTKNDIIDILQVPKEKITVIYHGGPIIEEIKTPPIITSPYFLYVGVRDFYKNFNQTLIDFSKVTNKYPNIKLVCTGYDFTKNENRLISQLNMQNNIVYIKADNEQLKNLYTYAIAFIYPSLYEGFGMPILEAFAYGCPVLLNNKSCFPEIAKDAGIYFESDNSGSNLSERLFEAIIWSSEDRENIKQNGYNRLAEFSWEKSSLQLANLYNEIVQ